MLRVEYSYQCTALTQPPSAVVLWIFPWEPVDKRGRRILLEWVYAKLIRLYLHFNRFHLTGCHRCVGPDRHHQLSREVSEV